MIYQVKRFLARCLERRGYVRSTANWDLHGVMARRQDVSAETVIDVGASDGRWSAGMMQHFPRAKYLLVEAQEKAHGAGLQQFAARHANVEYVLCAAGDRAGEIQFDASGAFGGTAGTLPFAQNNIVVPMATIDTLVRERGLRPPFLLKLDTHGFEVPILNGARETVSRAAMLIIEAYNFTLQPGCLRFYELCALLEERGFRCVDMFDLMFRPGDRALWQMDIAFMPASHPVFQSSEYGAGWS
jgi:FkbM family methyltransferase